VQITGRNIVEVTGRAIDPEFDINLNESIISLYRILYDYLFSKNPKLTRSKGLVLTGIEGTGKTLAIEVVKNLIYTYGDEKRRFTIVRYEKIVEQYRDLNNEIFDLYGYEKKRDICFDDFLTTDNRQRSDYGERVQLADMLIKDRYSAYKNFGLLTHITTNQNLESLKQIMSPSAYDRLIEMNHFINIHGTSIRKSKISEVSNEY